MIENPHVNRYLKDKAMDLIDHALGRPLWPLRESYRNYYAVDFNTLPAIDFACSPHWQERNRHADMAWFSVTQAGRVALAAYLGNLPSEIRWRGFTVTFEGYSDIVSARSRAKARYRKWLDISDAYPDLSFGEFARRATVRPARGEELR